LPLPAGQQVCWQSRFSEAQKQPFHRRSMNLGIQLAHIRFETPTLAPVAHTRFCIEYVDER
jgi:hypothetical protein